MRLVHYHLPDEGGAWGVVEAGRVRLVATDRGSGGAFLASLLQWPDPERLLREACGEPGGDGMPFDDLAADEPDPSRPHLLAPIDHQEVWAAGVTYLRSKVARMEESEGAARFYDMVYDAERPELFLKATPSRVSGPRAPVRIRTDARWNVPEPEIAVLLSPGMKIVGYTIGNDMSSRDIEGENPLYLPQAKVYRQACALGPAIWLEREPREHRALEIAMTIERGGATAFSGQTSSGQMKRRFAELAGWLGRDNLFPHGAFLLTGTGLVPGDDFTLQPGDTVTISVPEIGTLRNPVVQGGPA
jgi:2-dehydro-3-deoxy-D-arabinonate dehydratase